jgi:hypothetical protein
MTSSIDIVLDALTSFSSVDIRAYLVNDDESTIIEFDHSKSREHKHLIEFANVLFDHHALANDNINFRFVLDKERTREISRIANEFKTYVLDHLAIENASFKKANNSDMFITMSDFEDIYSDALEYSIDENDMLVQQFH